MQLVRLLQDVVERQSRSLERSPLPLMTIRSLNPLHPAVKNRTPANVSKAKPNRTRMYVSFNPARATRDNEMEP